MMRVTIKEQNNTLSIWRVKTDDLVTAIKVLAKEYKKRGKEIQKFKKIELL